jgi:hypothetical protein
MVFKIAEKLHYILLAAAVDTAAQIDVGDGPSYTSESTKYIEGSASAGLPSAMMSWV